MSAHLLGYARVSTTAQDPALQHDALTAAGCYRVWTDTASGALTARPALDDVLGRLGPGDVLVVWRLDRLARSLRHLLQLIDELTSRGVGFRSLTESIDTTTATGRLVLHLFGALGEFERDLLRERTAAGLEAAAARGRAAWRPPGGDDSRQARRSAGTTNRWALNGSSRRRRRCFARHAISEAAGLLPGLVMRAGSLDGRRIHRAK